MSHCIINDNLKYCQGHCGLMLLVFKKCITMLKCNGFFSLYVTVTGDARSWNISMEQCRKKHSGYLFGDVILNNPRILCQQIPSHILVVWVGVRRQKYKNVDQGIYKHLIFIFILEEKHFFAIFFWGGGFHLPIMCKHILK